MVFTLCFDLNWVIEMHVIDMSSISVLSSWWQAQVRSKNLYFEIFCFSQSGIELETSHWRGTLLFVEIVAYSCLESEIKKNKANTKQNHVAQAHGALWQCWLQFHITLLFQTLFEMLIFYLFFRNWYIKITIWTAYKETSNWYIHGKVII